MVAGPMGKDVEGLSELEAAELSTEAVEDLLSAPEVSCRLRDYGISKEAIPVLIEKGIKYTWLFMNNPRDLREQDVRAIYEAAY